MLSRVATDLFSVSLFPVLQVEADRGEDLGVIASILPDVQVSMNSVISTLKGWFYDSVHVSAHRYQVAVLVVAVT